MLAFPHTITPVSIHILPETLVSRIAAGEVVERPASAVKEMIENAIDAGATEIKIECAEGGRRLIRITDNGAGIPVDEVTLAFTHHATSKLNEIEDLDHIRTLGFRGEALASIAAVSIVTCATRHTSEPRGTLIRIDNGNVITHEALGRPPGTTMTVENVFARIPARLKFLKSTQTERGHIDGVVTRYALAYPNIRFTLVQDGKPQFQSNGNGKMQDVLVETHGADVAAKMVAVSAENEEAESAIQVSGYASLPEMSHNNRSKITLFVNGRPVQDTKLAYAVIQAYHTLLMVGRYPVAVVMVNVPSEEVDVNAHPAKAEVRFQNADSVFSAVQRAVRKALLPNLPVPEPPSVFQSPIASSFGGWNPPPTSDPSQREEESMVIVPSAEPTQPHLRGSEAWEKIGIAPNMAMAQRPAIDFASQITPQVRVSNLPALRILGQLALTYIIAEGPEGLYLIDQHAAHERILFERMLAQRDLGEVVSQPLLDPVPADVPLESAYRLEESLPILRDLGFEIEHFGGKSFLVRAVPALMVQDDIVAAVRDIVADLETGDAPMRKDIEARVLRRVCKRMAIKAGRVLSLQEMAALVRDLESCESPRTCPHGRPTMIQIGTSQLEKEFGRAK